MSKQQLIESLNLIPHEEGGYYSVQHLSCHKIPDMSNKSTRRAFDSIFYMLTDDSPIGYFHLNQSDILHFFHCGSPISYYTISPDGCLKKQILGPDPTLGHHLQLIVKGGIWKASLLDHGDYGLISEVVFPGFRREERVIATYPDLSKKFPHVKTNIKSLTYPSEDAIPKYGVA